VLATKSLNFAAGRVDESFAIPSPLENLADVNAPVLPPDFGDESVVLGPFLIADRRLGARLGLPKRDEITCSLDICGRNN
jgi:hypothetical protein